MDAKAGSFTIMQVINPQGASAITKAATIAAARTFTIEKIVNPHGSVPPFAAGAIAAWAAPALEQEDAAQHSARSQPLRARLFTVEQRAGLPPYGQASAAGQSSSATSFKIEQIVAPKGPAVVAAEGVSHVDVVPTEAVTGASVTSNAALSQLVASESADGDAVATAIPVAIPGEIIE